MMKIPFQLGDDVIHAVVHQKECASPTMLNVHDDEDTSVEAGRKNIEHHGGRVIELVHTGERLITFRLDGQTYVFDPNRMFSDAGITATLRRYSKYSEAAHAAIKSLATLYLDRFALDREPLIIALHNIYDAVFSVESFAPPGNLSCDVAATHINPRHSKFDFFYVTEKRFYDYLKNRNFNVVLQDNERVTEDGSLSVYFARKGIPYINVEAQIEHLANQIEMLEVVREMLKSTNHGEV
ncbi:MAG TPA: hypothetical protein VFC07_15815 [Verrucomicrobiae bacterium]|nr:hypothetical protein [Verrucomicrobiae bacterium]